MGIINEPAFRRQRPEKSDVDSGKDQNMDPYLKRQRDGLRIIQESDLARILYILIALAISLPEFVLKHLALGEYHVSI